MKSLYACGNPIECGPSVWSLSGRAPCQSARAQHHPAAHVGRRRAGRTGPRWQLLVRVEPGGMGLDARASADTGWEATPHQRFERLLRESGVHPGVLISDRTLRVILLPSPGPARAPGVRKGLLPSMSAFLEPLHRAVQWRFRC